MSLNSMPRRAQSNRLPDEGWWRGDKWGLALALAVCAHCGGVALRLDVELPRGRGRGGVTMGLAVRHGLNPEAAGAQAWALGLRLHCWHHWRQRRTGVQLAAVAVRRARCRPGAAGGPGVPGCALHSRVVITGTALLAPRWLGRRATSPATPARTVCRARRDSG